MSETDETNEMANKNAEIDPSMIEGVVGDTWNTYLGSAVEPRPLRGGGQATDTSAGSTQPTEATGTDESQVEARIRIRGDAEWEVTLRGSWSSAREATRRMLGSSDQIGGGSEGNAGTPEYVLDAWGELVNIVAGNLKASLELAAHDLSIPEVFRDGPSPAVTQDATEFLFEWDGYLAIVRIARITLA